MDKLKKLIYRLSISISYFFVSIIFFTSSLIIQSIRKIKSKKIFISKKEKEIDGVSFIIPTWNNKNMVLNCIYLLDRYLINEEPKIKKEIIIIDNGSIDGSEKAIQKLTTKTPLVIIKQNTNIGFSPAINLGLKKAKYNYVYLINNDMEVQKNFFSSLVLSANKLIKDKINFFGITSQIFFFDKTKRREESGKTYLIPKNIGFIEINHYIQTETLQNFSPTLYPGGGASLINKHYLNKIGCYDHKAYTPLYCEDLDAGFIAWKLGLPSFFNPNSVVIHHHRSSSKILIQNPSYFMYKNWLVFILKNFESPINIIKHLIGYPVLILLSEEYSKYAIESIKNIRNIFLSRIKNDKYKRVNSDKDLINFTKFECNLK